jgi:beta-galactosidase
MASLNQRETVIKHGETAFNRDWLFDGPVQAPGGTDRLRRDVAAAYAAPNLDDSGWQQVTLPHTVTPLSWRDWDPESWESVWAYRRHFTKPADSDGERVFLGLDGAMTVAVVSLNGKEIGVHRGGYLPFSFELTDGLHDGDNVLSVLLDSRPHINVPPNLPNPAPSSSIDFWQPGGITREAALRVVPRSFIAGLATTHSDVLDPVARRSTFAITVDSLDGIAGAAVSVAVVDAAGVTVSAATQRAEIPVGVSALTVEVDGLAAITLWDTDNPVLYRVVATLLIDGLPVDTEELRTGYREARWTPHGFFLNGKHTYLFGVNRHALYPFAGFSMPPRVQRRDAEILKYELNCNFVRCSHYPQAAAFLDACDELGILVWEEPPGWQFVGDQRWQDHSVETLTGMVARDRHRPSVVVWAARLNETPDHPEFYARTEALVKRLDPSRATSGTLLGDDSRTAIFQHDIFSYDDYNTALEPDGERHPILLPPVENQPYLVSEGISSRSSPTSYYRRTEIARVQQHQSIDYAYAHDIARSDDRHSGVLAWAAFDYQAGFGNHYHGLKTGGFGDVFRILKPGAAFYRSQVDPATRIVLEPAFTWDPPQVPAGTNVGLLEQVEWGPGERAVICSNVDRVEVFLDGISRGVAFPESARFPAIDHAPFVVDLALEPGAAPELRIDGYLGERLVATRRFSGDRRRDTLVLRADDAALRADGVDATRIVFGIADEHGEFRGHARAVVRFEVHGPATLVGESPFDLEATGAVGAIWIRTLPNEPGDIVVRAFAEGFGSEVLALSSVGHTA